MHDLRTRALIVRYAVPGALSVAVDQAAHVAYVGTSGGEVLAFATDVSTDELQAAAAAHAPVLRATVGAPVERLWVVGDDDYLVAGTPDSGLVTLDAATGIELSRTTLDGRAEVVDAGRVTALVATPAELPDPAAAAAEVVPLVGGDEAAVRARLEQDLPRVVVTTDIAANREAIDAGIADGSLAGLSVEDVPRVAVADAAGVTLLEPATGSITGTVPLADPATGLVAVEGLEAPTLYAAGGSTLSVVEMPTGDSAASLKQTVWMPGAVERIAFNDATQLVHVLGRTPDGGASTVYVVEPRGNSVFADAAIPFTPAAWALDTAAPYPSERPPAAPALRRGRLERGGGRGPERLCVARPRHGGRRRDGGAALPAGPRPLPAPFDCRDRRPAGPRRRDALRAVPDRDERRVRGPLHHGRRWPSLPRSGPAPGAGGAPSGWACRSSVSSSASPWPRSGWPSTRSAGSRS